jgi:hypothetical protein
LVLTKPTLQSVNRVAAAEILPLTAVRELNPYRSSWLGNSFLPVAFRMLSMKKALVATPNAVVRGCLVRVVAA